MLHKTDGTAGRRQQVRQNQNTMNAKADNLRSKRVWLAGVPVDPLTQQDILDLFRNSVAGNESRILANVNLHGMYEFFRHPRMRELLLHPESLVHIDGTPILWLCNLLGTKLTQSSRNAHIDLIPPMLKICAENDWAVVLVGSDVAGAKRNQSTFTQMFPNLKLHCFDGYFDSEDQSLNSKSSQLVKHISKLEPALLLVGMGMPRQEIWLLENRMNFNANLMMPVGGFADYFAGRTKMPPRMLGKFSLEWLYRLATNPRRLGFRYLIEPFLLLGLLMKQTLSGAKWGKNYPANEYEK
jgi:N-acetylglucosaminyldiphosphoundecaprenol N-acetyl-beta-D-mannosaminyltransferase